MSQKISYKRIILTIFKLSITLSLLFYIVFKLDWNKFIVNYKLTLSGYTIMCMLVLTSLILDTFRFLLVLKIWGVNLTIWQALKLNWIGLFFNNLLPGSVGGDIMKSYYLYKMGHRFVNILFVSFLDRACGLYGLLINYLLIGLYPAYNHSKTIFYAGTGIYLFILVCTLLIILSAKCQRLFLLIIQKIPIIKPYKDTIFIPFVDYLKKPQQFLPPIFISIITHIFLITTFFVGSSFWQTNHPHNFFNFFSIVPIGSIVTAIPISISGWGTGEAAFGFIYDKFEYPFEVGVAVSILYKFTLIVLSIPGFVLWIYWLFSNNSQIKI